MTTKKQHPADAADAAFIANATLFELSVFRGRGKYETETAATLDEAKAKAAELEAKHPNGKNAMIYAIDGSGRRALYVAPHNGIPAFLKRDKAPKADPTAAAMTELRKIAESAADLDLDPNNPAPTETAMTTKTEHAPEPELVKTAKPTEKAKAVPKAKHPPKIGAAPRGKATKAGKDATNAAPKALAAKVAKPAPAPKASAKRAPKAVKTKAANGKPPAKGGSKSETVLAMLRKGAPASRSSRRRAGKLT